MPIDRAKFKNQLPYASELFGLYQPLLGWRSARISKRITDSMRETDDRVFRSVSGLFSPEMTVNPDLLVVDTLKTGRKSRASAISYNPIITSFVADEISKRIQAAEPGQPAHWRKFLTTDELDNILDSVRPQIADYYKNLTVDLSSEQRLGLVTAAAQRESVVAGLLNHLSEAKLYTELQGLFTAPFPAVNTGNYHAMKEFYDPFENFDPKTGIDRVGLSPIGVVHLFRQYFFEFDNFLGPPVQHVWLSPGGTVELVEVSTRKTIVERAVETAMERVVKTEKAVTNQDELSDAVKQENDTNTKLGASVTGKENWGWGQAEETGTFSLEETQKNARETTHKQMRQQTEKLAEEIKQSFKSTFRTVTETTDTSSRRYVLQNASPDKLLNYELRRKMRRVGIQVQDVGTQLCWQTYVDDPGGALGVSKLVHIAQPADVSTVQPAALLTPPEGYEEPYAGQFNLPPIGGTYGGAWEMKPPIEPKPKYGYVYEKYSGFHFVSGGSVDVMLDENKADPAKPVLTIYMLHGHSNTGGELMGYELKLHFKPADWYITQIKNRNDDAISKVSKDQERLDQDAYFKAARERIKLASNIQPRRYEDLREEERIVVYRRLIASLLDVGVGLADPRVMHTLAELISSIFDVDKMLYFVAPEWWKARLHTSRQELLPEVTPIGGVASGKALIAAAKAGIKIQGTPGGAQVEGTCARIPTGLDAHVVGWGGIHETGRDNYFITEESAPAALGSSLGWLLQLDGDPLRNAFLNAPWVKAVIPIRPGKELAAVNWLSHAKIEGTDGLDDLYQAANAQERPTMLTELHQHDWKDSALNTYYANLLPENITVRDALRYLALVIQAKHEASREIVSEDLGDNITLNYLPTDKVFEHGFDPLREGFRATPEKGKHFRVFDEWIEVLPTDQHVAVAVEYDARTGLQK